MDQFQKYLFRNVGIGFSIVVFAKCYELEITFVVSLHSLETLGQGIVHFVECFGPQTYDIQSLLSALSGTMGQTCCHPYLALKLCLEWIF